MAVRPPHPVRAPGGELLLDDGLRRGARDRGRGAGRLRVLPHAPRATATGPVPSTASGAGSSNVDGEHIPDCWDDEHRSNCSDSSVTRRSASARATRPATGSWRASSPATGPSSVCPPTPTIVLRTEHAPAARTGSSAQLPEATRSRDRRAGSSHVRPLGRDLCDDARVADGRPGAPTRRRAARAPDASGPARALRPAPPVHDPARHSSPHRCARRGRCGTSPQGRCSDASST